MLTLTEQASHVGDGPQDDASDASLLTPDDLHLFNEGSHYRLYRKLGSRLLSVNGTTGAQFAVWAPNAEQVSVMGSFNNWDKACYPLHPVGTSGIWEGFVPKVGQGALYKYHIQSRYNHYCVDKPDPFGFHFERAQRGASTLWDLDYAWHDDAWMLQRADRQGAGAPVSIYELHLGSWMRVPEEGDRFLTYRELAERLRAFRTRTGFTPVEFMPGMEHPFYG